MKNNTKIPAILLAGIAIGAAAYYLFATDEGKKSLNDLTDSLNDLADSAMEKTRDSISDIKDRVRNV
ncbi:MAG TPA: YtxH domain-containing protein [Pedobacter sp.]|jgi:gas vesicle protein